MKIRQFLMALVAILLLPIESEGKTPSCLVGSPTDRIETAKERDPTKIVVREGTVVLEMRQGVNFPCIGIQFSDKNINMALGTYLEIKRQGDLYLINIQYETKRFSTIDKGIEAYLKNLFKRFYDNKDKTQGGIAWEAFVEEGGLQQFIDTAKEWIDDAFLDTPFNTTYG